MLKRNFINLISGSLIAAMGLATGLTGDSTAFAAPQRTPTSKTTHRAHAKTHKGKHHRAAGKKHSVRKHRKAGKKTHVKHHKAHKHVQHKARRA